MSKDQPDGAPIPTSAPPKPSRAPTTFFTARLRIPTNYITLPTQWLTTYQSFVRHNASQVSSLESALRSLTYLLPGTRVADTPLTSESLHTFLSLLTAYHTYLLASPPFSPQRRYERFWEAKSKIYAGCAALLRTVQYTQLLLEMLAKRAGEKARWRVIVLLEVVKAVCRLCMSRASGSRPVIATGVGDERTERSVGKPADEEGGNSATKDREWKMPRTGMRLPALPTITAKEGGAGAGSKEPILDFLTSRAITPDDIKPPPRLVRTLHSLPTAAHLAEYIYILRPVLHALALQYHHTTTPTNTTSNRNRAWPPWLLGFALEFAALQLNKTYTSPPSSTSSASPTSSISNPPSTLELDESRRRSRQLYRWFLRGAFYEDVTGKIVRGVGGRLKGVPVVGEMMAGVLGDYDFLWGEFYFGGASL